MVAHKVFFALLHLTIFSTSVVSGKRRIFLGNLEEGQNCGNNSEGNGYFGVCSQPNYCGHALSEYLQNLRLLQNCAKENTKNKKLICCSKDDLETFKPYVPSRESLKTLEYSECVNRYLVHRSNHYKKKLFLLNGKTVFEGEFPNMVAIGWTQSDKSVEYNCGGSIITNLFIVTAAHCSSLDK